jgi:hypothetical protein
MPSDARGSGCLTFLAVIAAGLFVLVAPLTLVAFNFERSFLEPDLYKRAMVEQDVYQRLPDLVAEQLVYGSTARPTGEEAENGDEGDGSSEESFYAQTMALASPELTSCLEGELGPLAYGELAADERPPTEAETEQFKGCLRIHGVPAQLADTHDGMPIYFWMLTEEDWQAILTALLPAEWLQTQIESVIDQVYEALHGDGSTVMIPMADLKERIAGDDGFDAVLALMEAQPPCSDDQLAQIQALADPTEPLKDVPMCRPPDAVLEAIYPNIRATLQFMADQIPDQAELKLGDDSGSSEDPLEQPRQVLGVVRAVAFLSLLLPVLLLGLIALLVVRSPRSLLRWWGTPIMLAGSLALVGAIAGLSSAPGAVADLVAGSRSHFTALAPGVLDLQAELMDAIVRGYLQAILVQAVLLTGVGTVMVAASFWVGRPALAPAEPESPGSPDSGVPPVY